MPDSFDVKK